MIITSISTDILRYELPYPMADALNYIPFRSAVLVYVHSDQGLIGIGEAASFGGPPESTAFIVERELAPLLVGQDPSEIERLWSRMFHRSMQHGRHGLLMAAISGLDIALWDLAGKVLNAPIHRLLGTFRSRLPAYASGGFYREGQTPQVLADEVASYLQRGFAGAKIKVGRSPAVALNPLGVVSDGDFCFHTVAQDLERVWAVRKRIGSGPQLMVDANSGWDRSTAARVLPALQEAGIAWLEEPLFPEDRRGSAQLAAQSAVPIAGYETVQGCYAFRELIDAGAVGIVQPDVTWTGGITECRRIGAFAACHNLPYVPHAFGSGIGLAANAQLLATLPNGLMLELDQTPNVLRDELLLHPLEVESDGFVSVPCGPGLGVELNPDAIEQYRVAR